ncbi:MAG: radical SAM protein, partial [Synergistaceae bacterium]|nr:radical SAM protein [Synergistaceae bacterium]
GGGRGLWERRVAAGYVCVLSTLTTAAERGTDLVTQLEQMKADWVEKGKTVTQDDMIPILTVQPKPVYIMDREWTIIDISRDYRPATGANGGGRDLTNILRYDGTKALRKVADGTGFNRSNYVPAQGQGSRDHQFFKNEYTWLGGRGEVPLWNGIMGNNNVRERIRPYAYIFDGPYASELASRMLTAEIEVKRLAEDVTVDVEGWHYNQQPYIDLASTTAAGWRNRDVTIKEIKNRTFKKDETYVVYLAQLPIHLIPIYMEPDLPWNVASCIFLPYMSVARGGASTGNLHAGLIGVEMPAYRYLKEVDLPTYDVDHSHPLVNRGAVVRFFDYHTQEETAAIAEACGEKIIVAFDYDFQVHTRTDALVDGKFDITLPSTSKNSRYMVQKKDGSYENLALKSRKTAGWNVATIVVADHGQNPFTIDLGANGRPVVGSGSDRTLARTLPANDDLVGVRIVEILAPTSVTPFAVVEKLNGNKNNLTITIIEVYEKGMVQIQETFSIANNAADTYPVGDYMVYVDTKGNDQIRECYIKEVLESGGPNAAPIVTPSARVEKLSGNTNNLFITVKEVPPVGAPVVFDAKFSISNNASGTYKVGPYNVYVATKGNDKIEQCYIK